jgi:hypothetical protein
LGLSELLVRFLLQFYHPSSPYRGNWQTDYLYLFISIALVASLVELIAGSAADLVVPVVPVVPAALAFCL